jgi:CRISPR-associated Csx11 family protein
MSDLRILAQHRNAILLAEVAAWLHMLGKYHESFLHGNHNLAVQIPSDIENPFPHLNALLTDPWPGTIWSSLPVPELKAATLSIFDLIKSHHNPNAPSGLERLMWDAHGRGSGTEKGVLERFAPGQQSIVFPATAVGNELTAIDLDQLQERRKELYKALEIWLDELRNTHAALNQQEWARLRHDLIDRLATEFRTSVAETRRPLNDVTLFDQTATSVALLKATLAQNLLSGWKEPNQAAVKDKYHWRLLRVGLAGPAFWGMAVRISDLLARKGQVDVALNHVRDLLEVTYPLGAEIYRDENGSLFIVPDIADLLDAVADRGPLRDQLNEIAEKTLDRETLFSFELSKQTRNVLILGRLAATELPAPTPKPEWLQEMWQLGRPSEICPVCGLRPQGLSKKAADRKVCDVCEQRRSDRSRQWIDELTSTIWIDEIADNNGRLGILVARFELEAWLTGEAFGTVPMFDPTNRQITDPGRDNKAYKFDYDQLLKDIEEASRRKQFKDNTLLGDLVLRNARGGGFEQFYDIQVSDSDLNEHHTTRSATLLAVTMLRQNPSFARIRRVWETTRRFWQEVLPTNEHGNITQSLAAHQMGQASSRLAITATLMPRQKEDAPGPYRAYELVLSGGVTLSVIWDERNRRFITAENLVYIAQLLALSPPVPEKVRDILQGTFTIKEPTGYGTTSVSFVQSAAKTRKAASD